MANKKLEHVAIILDGNGRWATKQGKPRIYGHEKGFLQLKPIILAAIKEKIPYLTLFCFSTENWNRPDQEVKYLMEVPTLFVKNKKYDFLMQEKIKINHLGRKTKMPKATLEAFNYLEQLTSSNDAITINIAFDYGSYEELLSAINNIKKNKILKNNEVTEEILLNNLYTANQPLVDLIIRSGGEKRLSNFLLLQASYAELYFTDTLWPDFNEKYFQMALKDYYARTRRFGSIK